MLTVKTIAVLNHKGGSSKTTTSTLLAGTAARRGLSVALFDIDALQTSALKWAERRAARELGDDLHAQAVVASRLPQEIEKIRNDGADLLIVDTGASSEAGALAAARVADLVIVPVHTGVMDVEGMRSTIEVADLARARGRVLIVLSSVPASRVGSDKGDDAAEAIAKMHGADLEICPIRIGRRQAWSDVMQHGMDVAELTGRDFKRAAEEATALSTFVFTRLGL